MKYTLMCACSVCVYAPSEKTKYSFQFLLTEKNSQYLIAIGHCLLISYLTNWIKLIGFFDIQGFVVEQP